MMKKNWNNPELKNLSIENTNEGEAPLYYDPNAQQPCICKLLESAEYGRVCPYPAIPCKHYTPFTSNDPCATGRCQYADPTVSHS